MITRYAAPLARVIFCSLLAVTAAQACGPDFSPDIFVRLNRPDLPKRYAQGRLGLLQPSFARADLLVAYRYLSGGTLDAQEQKGWAPTYSPNEPEWMQREDAQNASGTQQADTPVAQWMLARKAFPTPPSAPINPFRPIHINTNGGYEFEANYLNCTDDAFRTARTTLQDRAAKWGNTSAALLDWLHAQDAVFANCGGGSTLPAPAPADSLPLLVKDRAYQIAAAHFYSAQFPEAALEFLAIGKDKESPWHEIAGYLAARAMIRQAFFAKTDSAAPATYDPALMQAAAQQLRAYLAQTPPPSLQQAAEAQLALVRIRIEPGAQARELARNIAGPAHDENYGQNLTDLLWYLNAKTPDGLRAQPDRWQTVADEANTGQTRLVTAAEAAKRAQETRQKIYAQTEPVRALAPVIDWVLTLQSLADAAPAHALEQWRNTHTLAWLTAALMLAPENASAPQDLLDAAAKVAPDSPAWQTVTYHRVRLLLAAGHTAEARSVLQPALRQITQLPTEEREPSSINAFRGLAMLGAPTFADFLTYVPRTTLLATSEEKYSVDACRDVMKNPQRHYNCIAEIDPEQISRDAANIMNTQAPLSAWKTAAQSSKLSAQVREAIAMSGWTRAVLLRRDADATALMPLLPHPLQAQLNEGDALGRWIALVRNPGLGPYLNGGTQRAYSYDFVESYRDNWCYKPDDDLDKKEAPAFLTAPERQQGATQAQSLASLRAVNVGQNVLHAVRANPADPRAAEALYLILRMIRYGCTEPAAPPATPAPKCTPTYPIVADPMSKTPEARELFELRKDTSRMLRQHYAISPWTKKAAPFAQ